MAELNEDASRRSTLIAGQCSRWPSSWRPFVLARVAELDGIRAAYVAERLLLSEGEAATDQAAREHLVEARRAAQRNTDPPQPWRPWHHFNSVSHACYSLYSGQAAVIELAPEDALAAWRSEIRSVASRYLDPGDEAFRTLIRVESTDMTANEQRRLLSSVLRGVAAASQRYHARLRSFRNILHLSTCALAATAAAFAFVGVVAPGAIPLCFGAPVARVAGPLDGQIYETTDGQLLVAGTDPLDGATDPADDAGPSRSTTSPVSCPTGRVIMSTGRDTDPATPRTEIPAPEDRGDILLVLFLGAAGGALAGATTLRDLSGPPSMFGLPVALALLKLPSGAITAVVGLVLVKGAFLPGLSVLDTPGQIAAWALLLGISQQFITRVVDREGRSIVARAVPDRD